jgi:hypothetical protein
VVGGEWRYYVYDLLNYVMGSGVDREGDRSGGDPERAFGARVACFVSVESAYLWGKAGGPAWTRTRDLFLIREAL